MRGGCGMAASGHCGEMLLLGSSAILEDALEGGFSSQLIPQLQACWERAWRFFAVLCFLFPERWGTSCLSLEVHTPPCSLSFFSTIQHASVAMSILSGESFGFP